MPGGPGASTFGTAARQVHHEHSTSNGTGDVESSHNDDQAGVLDISGSTGVSGVSSTTQSANNEPFEDIPHSLLTVPPEIVRGKHFSVPGKRPKPGLNSSLPPIHRIEEIFDDLTIQAEKNGLNAFLQHIGTRELRVATMCSGTEAPLLALEMVRDSKFICCVLQ